MGAVEKQMDTRRPGGQWQTLIEALISAAHTAEKSRASAEEVKAEA